MRNILKAFIVFILTLEARIILRKYNPKIIAVTGSVGKTSAKDAIYAALKGAKSSRKSEKSFNSEFGVPLAILNRESGWNNPLQWLGNIFAGARLIIARAEYPDWLILEVGADRPGDISRTAKWLRPDVAVITGVPDTPVHVEFFHSAEDVAREKQELARHAKEGAVLVVNGDDDRALLMRGGFKGKLLRYGFGSKNDVRAADEGIIYEKSRPSGMSFRVEEEGASVPIEIRGGLGRAHVYSILAAFAVGRTVGLDMIAIAEALQSHIPPPGRMRIIEGKNRSIILDDTYNASPAAASSALSALKEVKAEGRKIALLADMLELGRLTAEAHKDVGVQAAKAVDMLVVVGIRASAIAQAAIAEGFPEERIRRYAKGESQKAGEDMAQSLQKGDVVLVKGSQSMRMERATKALMADPSQAKDLLVRQDEAWQVR